MASIVWELARMDPDTLYIVDPWSVRGYQSIHGAVIFTIGALALVYAVVTMVEISVQPLWSRVFAALMALGAVAAAAIYGGSETSMGGGLFGWLLAILGGYIASKAVRMALTSVDSTTRAFVTIGTTVAAILLLNLLVFGQSRTARPWVWIAIAAVLVLGLASTGKHPQLSSNRMMIYMATGGWLAIALSAAAARVNLLTAQTEETGTTQLIGDYNDTQVTSGYFVALLGMLIVVIGAISLWAKRRDIIINQERAERQRAAAEASAAEIQAALELAKAHQRQARTARST